MNAISLNINKISAKSGIISKFNFVRGGLKILFLFVFLQNSHSQNPCNTYPISGKISEQYPSSINKITNPFLVIDGILEIDKDFEFVGQGTIALTPNSKILIHDNIILKIWDNITITNCSSDPWKSIELAGVNSRLYISNNTKIEGAEIGINSGNGGIVDISNSIIKDCNTLVNLGGKFTTRIRSNSILQGGILANGTSTYYGVYITELDNLTRIFNFKDSKLTLPPSTNGTGIYVTGNYSATMNFSIENCKFQDVYSCISLNESAAIKSIKKTSFSIPFSYQTVYAIYNKSGTGVTMDSDTLFSSLIYSPANKGYIYPVQYLYYDENIQYSWTVINNCVFKNFQSGIYSYNCNKGHSITNCKFENVLHGISIVNYNFSKKLIRNYITNNYFSSSHTFGLPTSEAGIGIYIDDLYSINEVKLNQMYFIGGQITGLYLANVTNGSLISENVFSNTGKFITPGFNTAIYFAGSPGNISRYNYTNNYSRGQTFIGPVENTKFYCNQFDCHNDGLLIN